MHTASIITRFWHDQIVQHGRQGTFLLLVSFLLAFLFIRTSARLTRSVSWWPGGVETESGVHLHHLVWGICLMMVSGVLAYSLRYESPWWELTAVGFGIGAGLTLDEFALWVYLQDVYWAERGRKSLDAVAIATVFMGLVFLGSRPFEFDPGPEIGVISWIVVVMALCVVSFLKERIVYGMVGMFFPPFAMLGAARLGKPGSPWAKWRYGDKNHGKQARSQDRFDDSNRRANKIKDALFNLVGGRSTDELQERKARTASAMAQEQAIEEVHERAQQTSAGDQ
ncbi:MAG: hypothetical protein WBD55_05620 [Dehalococcoidia bacterium]